MDRLAALGLNRSMSPLLAGILLFHAGWYMLLPFFAILFTSRRGLGPADVGLILAAQSIALLVGSLAGGELADRVGRRVTMVLGLALRAAGIGALGLLSGMPALLAVAAVAGVGGGLYGPAVKAAITLLAQGEGRTTAFAMRGIAANIGIGAGPLLGAFLLRGPMPVLFGVAALVHGTLAVVTWALVGEGGRVHEGKAGTVGRIHGGWASWKALLADRPFLAFSLVTVLSWAIFAQLVIAVPLYAQEVMGLQGRIALLFTAGSVAVILFQVPVTRLLAARLHPMTAMATGVLLLGAGLGLVGLAGGFPGLLGAVLLFMLGAMFLLPTADSTVSTMAKDGAVGAYFGVATFAWGLGEGIGSAGGGVLIQYALATGQVRLPWALYAAAGLGVAALFIGLRRHLPAQVSAEPVVAAPGIQVFRPGELAPGEGLPLGPQPEREEE